MNRPFPLWRNNSRWASVRKSTEACGIYSRVTSRPVEKDVQLREEHVSVHRRPADRPVSDADRAFEERTIEASETVERPVVSKEARIVEEVVVGKDVQQRTETVHNTVRRTDVQVDQVAAGKSSEAPLVDSLARNWPGTSDTAAATGTRWNRKCAGPSSSVTLATNGSSSRKRSIAGMRKSARRFRTWMCCGVNPAAHVRVFRA